MQTFVALLHSGLLQGRLKSLYVHNFCSYMSLLARTTSRCRIKWLIFYRCGFVFLSFFLSFFFFSTPNLWGHWTDLNQTWTQNLVRTARAFSPRGGGKNCFYLDRLWTLTEHIFATEHDINNQKVTCQSSGTSPYAPKFGKLVQKRLRTVGEFLTPPQFSHGETLSALPRHGRYITDSRQTLARVM